MAGRDKGGAGVVVYSGTAAAQSYFRDACCELALPCGVSLIHDHPWGYALAHVPKLPRPALVMTECPSPHYLRDVREHAPEGLVVVVRHSETVGELLARVAAGERFYHGPVLGPSPLTGRERAIFRLLAFGASHEEVAEQLGINSRTIRNYAATVREKLSLRTPAEWVLTYFGLLEAVAPVTTARDNITGQP